METQHQNKEQARYTGKKDLGTLYAVTEYWQSDLEFFNDELRFFRSLIDRYFAHFIEKVNIDKTRELTDKLIHIGKDQSALRQRVQEHLKHLAAQMKEPSASNEYEEAHTKLEMDTINFLRQFRAIKKEVFEHTEHVMESEKAKHLLGR